MYKCFPIFSLSVINIYEINESYTKTNKKTKRKENTNQLNSCSMNPHKQKHLRRDKSVRKSKPPIHETQQIAGTKQMPWHNNKKNDY